MDLEAMSKEDLIEYIKNILLNRYSGIEKPAAIIMEVI